MKLSKICEKIKYECLQGSMDAEVRDIIYDSRKIAKETMFVCMVGAVTDGHKYIPDAVEKGASVIVVVVFPFVPVSPIVISFSAG